MLDCLCCASRRSTRCQKTGDGVRFRVSHWYTTALFVALTFIVSWLEFPQALRILGVTNRNFGSLGGSWRV
jgi:hypothetical protein